jgi:hypothetical protein
MRIFPIPALIACAAVLQAGAADVVSFSLIDADTDQPVGGYDPIPAGARLDLSALPTKRLNVRANVGGSVGSVAFAWSGAESGAATESTAPYAMKGDTAGDYHPWTPTAGSYSLTATPYAGAGAGGGVAGAALTLAFAVVAGGAGADGDGSIAIGGELKRWHKVTLTMDGPWASETGTPNPFLDYRMDVTFRNGALTYVVPGYFAADGAAGESSASAGRKWRAHLCPDLTGTWTYSVSFRTGTDVSTAGGGSTLAPYHGRTGSFVVAETDKTGADFRGKGRLQYVGARYLRHAGNGEWFVKTGADAPENLLAYADFDGTSDHDGTPVKTWAPHVGDWKAGDPTWKGGRGKGLIGAIDYLAAKGMNVFSFLTYNCGGDGKDVWPYIGYTDVADHKLRFDCSKLDQWEVVFAHGDKLGMFLHFKTQETENDDNAPWALDGGELGRERKLYYRELIARFAHHLALNWNLGEENTQTTAQRQAMAQFFSDTDPYHHLVVLHTFPGNQEAAYRPLLGSASQLTGASIQIAWDAVHQEVAQWITESAAAGKPWVVANDEQGSAQVGIPPDPGWPGYDPTGKTTQDQTRKATLWGALMAGGCGIESYFGYSTVETDLTAQNFRSRDRWWDYCRHAKEFFTQHLPFAEMAGADVLVGNPAGGNSRYCLAERGSTYAVYLPDGGTADLDLTGVAGTFAVRWFDPRNGGALQTGSVASVGGGGARGLGMPPGSPTADWAVLVTLATTGNLPPHAAAGPDQTVQDGDGDGIQAVALSGAGSSDPDGAIASWVWREGGAQIASGVTVAPVLAVGTHTIVLTVTDGQGAAASDTVVVTVQPRSAGGFTVTLIDADTEQPIAGFAPLADGARFDLAALPSPRINLRADVGAVSVRFTWSGPESGSRVENAAPFAMKGDTAGNYAPWTPGTGTYALTVEAFAQPNAGGAPIASAVLAFTVADSAPAAPGGGG